MGHDLVDQNLAAWGAKAPELDVSGRHILWRIQLASRYIDQAIADFAGAHGRLSPSDAKLLIYLASLSPPHQMTPKEMVELLDLTSGSVTSLIDRMESSGYVERHPDPADRRGVLVRLTAEGRSTAAVLTENYVRFESELLGALGGEERAQLVQLLRKLLGAYEGKLSDAQKFKS
jgi:DNA-binding MarR family transcriptional regulator